MSDAPSDVDDDSPEVAAGPSDWWASGVSPVSYAEQRFYRRYRAHGGSRDVVGGWGLLRGPLDGEALRRAYELLVERHAVLRSRFAAHGDDVQRTVAAPAPFDLPIIDLSRIAEPDRTERLLELLKVDLDRPFDLARDLPLRAWLYRLEPELHATATRVHHVVFDATSGMLLAAERARAYAHVRRGAAPPEPAMKVQYPDYARWQRGYYVGERLERGRLALQRQLEGGVAVARALPRDHPLERLDAARAEDSLALAPAVAVTARIDAAVVRSIATHARRLRVNDSIWFLSAMAAVLGRRAQVARPIISVVTDGRLRVGRVLGLIGNFLTAAPMVIDLAGEPTFEALVSGGNRAMLRAMGGHDVPIVPLLHRTLPDFQRVQFNFLRQGTAGELEGLTSEDAPEALKQKVRPPNRGTLLDIYFQVQTMPDGAASALLVMNNALWERPAVEDLMQTLVGVIRLSANEPAESFDALLREAETAARSTALELSSFA